MLPKMYVILGTWPFMLYGGSESRVVARKWLEYPRPILEYQHLRCVLSRGIRSATTIEHNATRYSLMAFNFRKISLASLTRSAGNRSGACFLSKSKILGRLPSVGVGNLSPIITTHSSKPGTCSLPRHFLIISASSPPKLSSMPSIAVYWCLV